MNKHLKLAFIIAPILTVIAYVLTGYFSPKKEVNPGTYELILKGNCRPLHNSCLLRYADLEIKLISKQKQDKLQLAIISNKALDALSVALSNDRIDYKQFKIMKSESNKYWQILINENQVLDHFKFIRLASQVDQSNYFIESELSF